MVLRMQWTIISFIYIIKSRIPKGFGCIQDISNVFGKNVCIGQIYFYKNDNTRIIDVIPFQCMQGHIYPTFIALRTNIKCSVNGYTVGARIYLFNAKIVLKISHDFMD